MVLACDDVEVCSEPELTKAKSTVEFVTEAVILQYNFYTSGKPEMLYAQIHYFSKILLIRIYTDNHVISTLPSKLWYLFLLASCFWGWVDISSTSLFSIQFNQSKVSPSPTGLSQYTTILSIAAVLHTHSFDRKAWW